MTTKVYYKGKMAAVQFANDLLVYLKPDSPLTMTIERDMSGDFFVIFATSVSSEDTVATPSKQSMTISQETTPDG